MNTADLSIHVPLVWWLGTLAWFCLLLAGDLYLHRKPTVETSFSRAVKNSLIWIALGIMLGGLIWWNFGSEAGTKYFSGYLIEKALSLDNIFVWGTILAYLKIPKQYHYKVLFWGVFGAIVFRTLFVFAGIALIEAFQPVLLILGAILIFSAFRLLRSSESESFEPSKSGIIKYTNKFLPISKSLDGQKLFVVENGKRAMSLLFFAICVIELTDIMFAIDSVPATLGIVREPYIVLASNIAAILGLRALYFVIAALRDKFWLLNKSLSVILLFIGLSLIMSPTEVLGFKWFGIDIPTAFDLGFVGLVLTFSVIGSLVFSNRAKTE